MRQFRPQSRRLETTPIDKSTLPKSELTDQQQAVMDKRYQLSPKPSNTKNNSKEKSTMGRKKTTLQANEPETHQNTESSVKNVKNTDTAILLGKLNVAKSIAPIFQAMVYHPGALSTLEDKHNAVKNMVGCVESMLVHVFPEGASAGAIGLARLPLANIVADEWSAQAQKSTDIPILDDQAMKQYLEGILEILPVSKIDPFNSLPQTLSETLGNAARLSKIENAILAEQAKLKEPMKPLFFGQENARQLAAELLDEILELAEDKAPLLLEGLNIPSEYLHTTEMSIANTLTDYASTVILSESSQMLKTLSHVTTKPKDKEDAQKKQSTFKALLDEAKASPGLVHQMTLKSLSEAVDSHYPVDNKPSDDLHSDLAMSSMS